MKDWRQLRNASRRLRHGGGDLNCSVRLLQEAIEAATRTAPLEVPLLLNSLSNLQASIGDFRGAEDAASRSIDLERHFGPPVEESDRLGAYHSTLATALQKQGKYSEALIILDEAIRIFALHVGEEEDLMGNLRRFRQELETDSWRG